MARVDAHDKVKGAALFGSDRVPDGLTHAALATATIDRGRVLSVDTAAAGALEGVRLILTRIDPDELRSGGYLMAGGYGAQDFRPLTSDEIAYRGQPIALVVADDPVTATHAASLITAAYAEEPFAVTLDAPGAETLLQEEAIPLPFLADTSVGDAEAALADAEITVDQVYDHPSQNAAPMELLADVIEWRGDTLIVHEGRRTRGPCATAWPSSSASTRRTSRCSRRTPVGASARRTRCRRTPRWWPSPRGGWAGRSSWC